MGKKSAGTRGNNLDPSGEPVERQVQRFDPRGPDQVFRYQAGEGVVGKI